MAGEGWQWLDEGRWVAMAGHGMAMAKARAGEK